MAISRSAATLRVTRAAVAALVVLLATACGGQGAGQDSGATTSESSGRSPALATPSAHRPRTPSAVTSAATSAASNDTGASMNIELVIEGTKLPGSLDDTTVGRDFSSLLPLTLNLSDFHHTEKISDLPRRLSTEGAPAGTAASAGDITYYAPWGNLALFYRDFTYSEGLVRLGHLDPAAADVLAGLDDHASVTIAASD